MCIVCALGECRYKYDDACGHTRRCCGSDKSSMHARRVRHTFINIFWAGAERRENNAGAYWLDKPTETSAIRACVCQLIERIYSQTFQMRRNRPAYLRFCYIVSTLHTWRFCILRSRASVLYSLFANRIRKRSHARSNSHAQQIAIVSTSVRPLIHIEGARLNHMHAHSFAMHHPSSIIGIRFASASRTRALLWCLLASCLRRLRIFRGVIYHCLTHTRVDSMLLPNAPQDNGQKRLAHAYYADGTAQYSSNALPFCTRHAHAFASPGSRAQNGLICDWDNTESGLPSGCTRRRHISMDARNVDALACNPLHVSD